MDGLMNTRKYMSVIERFHNSCRTSSAGSTLEIVSKYLMKYKMLHDLHENIGERESVKSGA